jgi:hypothetical protein
VVEAGLLNGESLVDGSVDLSYVALLYDFLGVRADNEELVRKRREDK